MPQPVLPLPLYVPNNPLGPLLVRLKFQYSHLELKIGVKPSLIILKP